MKVVEQEETELSEYKRESSDYGDDKMLMSEEKEAIDQKLAEKAFDDEEWLFCFFFWVFFAF